MITILKSCKRISLKNIAWGFLYPFAEDKDKVGESKTGKALLKEIQENETGRDRLYTMFSTDPTGAISRELHSVYHATFFGTLCGAVYGGIVRSRVAYMDFIERNKATQFTHHYEAKKALQDRVSLSFAKGAFKWGWRAGLFTGSMVLMTTSISVYRGKSSFLEYSAAGGLTGALYKTNLGLRGILIGGLVGTTLGTVGGALAVMLLRATGMTMEELRYWQYQIHEKRAKPLLDKEYKMMDDVPELNVYFVMHNEKLKQSQPEVTSPAPNSNTKA